MNLKTPIQTDRPRLSRCVGISGDVVRAAVYRAFAAVLWVLSCVITPGGSTSAQEVRAAAPIAIGARLGGDERRTRFIMDLTHAVGFNVYVLNDPFRIIVDMPEVNFQLPPELGRTGRGLISAYRYGRFEAGKSRIVLDAMAPVLIEKSYSIKAVNGQPARLVIDLVRTDRITFLSKQAVSGPPPLDLPRQGARNPVPKPRPRIAKPAKPRLAIRQPSRPAAKPVIVIDPGHGGVDPGAIGRRGTTEKRIVFNFSKTLKAALLATGRYKVYLTRDNDTFMRLRDRVDIARRKKADLFIAVHADSLSAGKARGATVYTLSEKASDREAETLAAMENRADIIAGVNLRDTSDEVTGFLIDLAQRDTKNHSVRFARFLVKNMSGVTNLAGNPHRFAGFRVLTAPDVPSVLLELGYLSSADDETLLRSSKWRLKTAHSVVGAIDKYFRARFVERRR